MKLKFKKGEIVQYLRKIFLVMRITLLFILLSTAFAFSSNSYAQNTKLSLQMNNATVKDILKAIEDQSEFIFFYQDQQIDLNRIVNIVAEDKTVSEILAQLFAGTKNVYILRDRQITIGKSLAQIESKDLSSVRVFESAQQTQKKEITGTVKDSKGFPLPGVSVVVKGTTTGTVTDDYGRFTLSVPADAKSLTFSFVGMKQQEIVITGKTFLNIFLEEETVGLNEVVAVGYGKQSKANLTSAISTISPKDLGEISYTNIGQALQGVAPGLFIRDLGYNQGQSFLIRGQTTIGDNGPLTIVDGIPTSSYNVDPNNIESISILKDAAATAIYGARASSGVILITTKTGNLKKITITYDAYYSCGNPTTLPKSFGSLPSAKLMNEAASNSGAAPLFTDAQLQLFNTGNPSYPNNNWLNLLIKPEHRYKHYLSLSGGEEKTQYMLALSYANSDGIFDETVNDEFYNLQFNLSSKIRKNIELKLFVTLGRNNSLRPSVNGGMDNIYQHASSTAPFLPVKNPDGTWASFNTAGNYSRGFWNALWELKAGINSTQTDNASINASLTWELFKGLKYIGRAAISDGYGMNTTNIYSTSYSGGPPWQSDINSLSKGTSFSQQLNLQNFLQYDKIIGNHNISVLGGWDVEFDKSSSLTGARQNFQFNNLLTELSAPNSGDPSDITNLASNTIQTALQSAVGRIHYSYNSKYLMELSARVDGSSNFAPASRYGFFPAISAGWLLSKEDFFQMNNVDYLKIRVSNGTAGNNKVAGTYYSLMSFGSYYFNDNTVGVTAGEGAPSYQNLKWEKTNSSNIGIDFSIKKGLISGSLDGYNKITNDILLPSPVAGTVGTNRNGPEINAGSVRNRGVELVLTHENKIGKVHYNVSFTGAYNMSKVLKLSNAFSPYDTGYRVGDELGVVYGYEANGIFKTSQQATTYMTNTVTSGLSPQTSGGDIIYVDKNGDKTLDYRDVVPIAKTLPKYTYSCNLGASWKQFDIKVFLQGVGNVQGYHVNDLFGNYAWIPVEAANAWSPNNPNGNYPKPLLYGTKTYYQNFYTASNFWTFNAAYLRIKNVQLGYNLKLSSNNTFQSARIYLVGTNILTFSHFRKGYDPESPIGPSSYVPPLKTISLGLNVKF